MPTLSDLSNVLIGCRVVTRARWERAVRAARGDTAALLDSLAAGPPDWWPLTEPGELPPGLTDYQRAVIEAWLDGDPEPLARQLALNQFLLLEKLGEGGQGQVYRGRQLNPPRFVAIKTLTRDTDSGRARFEQEARAMMRVQHTAVARFHLYERVRDPDNKPTDEYLIAMEFVDGTDLHRRVRWSGPVAWPFVARWAGDLLGGLAAIHAAGFVHRDVKPANVVVLGPPPEPGTRPSATAAKLLDFGAVGRTEDQPTGQGNKRTFVGTREYAPPEQWVERVVPASDVYALGCTLYCALTGHPPYQIEGRDAIAFMKAHARAPIPRARDEVPDVPEALDDLLRRMMAKRADERGTAAELAAAFARLLPPDDAPPADARPVRKAAPARAAKKVPAPAARSREPEPQNPLARLADPVLGLFERLFLSAAVRPAPGHELTPGERLAVLVRQPLVIAAAAALLGLILFLAFR